MGCWFEQDGTWIRFRCRFHMISWYLKNFKPTCQLLLASTKQTLNHKISKEINILASQSLPPTPCHGHGNHPSRVQWIIIAKVTTPTDDVRDSVVCWYNVSPLSLSVVVPVVRVMVQYGYYTMAGRGAGKVLETGTGYTKHAEKTNYILIACNCIICIHNNISLSPCYQENTEWISMNLRRLTGS